MKIRFRKALLPDGWADDVEISIENRRITGVESNVSRPATREVQNVSGYALPGMTNVHSHAFQHAFAGLGEYPTGRHDSFWTWRKLMYGFLENLTPPDLYEIGSRLYSEMLAAGYTTVGEFHYVLHQGDGTPYENINETADALIQAAVDTGINICMLPVYYQRGGFDDAGLQGGQRRFGSSRDLFLRMVEKLKSDWGGHAGVRPGFALHSLRAVSVAAGQAIVADLDRLLPGCPIHIHVAEQTREVEDCLAACGRRPVELLLDSFDVNPRWCLIHATHMTDEECSRVARCGAVIGVCPTTEANLGDGIFRAEEYLQAGGHLAIGSDSHISVDVREELRLLEYSQRLSRRRRAILCSEQQSCGPLLWDRAATGGAAATGFGSPHLEEGAFANISLVDPQMAERVPLERLLDVQIFHSSPAIPPLAALPLRKN